MVGPARPEAELELLCLFSSAAFRGRELRGERQGGRETGGEGVAGNGVVLSDGRAREQARACMRLRLSAFSPSEAGPVGDGRCLSLSLPLQPKRKKSQSRALILVPALSVSQSPSACVPLLPRRQPLHVLIDMCLA